MNEFIGSRAERQWLRTLQRIADALEVIAEELERKNREEEGS